MSTTELKEKKQRVQSEDDSVPASTITSPLCMYNHLHDNINIYKRGFIMCMHSVTAFTLTGTDLGDTLEHILSYLDGLSLSRAELVCRRWNEVIVYRSLWRKLYEKKLKKM